jgi:hypothetical protein
LRTGGKARKHYLLIAELGSEFTRHEQVENEQMVNRKDVCRFGQNKQN